MHLSKKWLGAGDVVDTRCTPCLKRRWELAIGSYCRNGGKLQQNCSNFRRQTCSKIAAKIAATFAGNPRKGHRTMVLMSRTSVPRVDQLVVD